MSATAQMRNDLALIEQVNSPGRPVNYHRCAKCGIRFAETWWQTVYPEEGYTEAMIAESRKQQQARWARGVYAEDDGGGYMSYVSGPAPVTLLEACERIYGPHLCEREPPR